MMPKELLAAGSILVAVVFIHMEPKDDPPFPIQEP